VRHQWYCFAEDTAKRGTVRVFVLSRMKNARATASGFKPRKFSIEKYLRHSLGVFSGSGSHDVRIWFDAFAAQYVRERNWRAGQKIRELADGELELSPHLSDLAEIEQWILSWGVHARALAPKPLTLRLRDIIRQQAKYYGA
jgi:proteasome accessory factor B